MKGESVGESDMCCEWFKCTECGENCITVSDNYCSNCGMPTKKSPKKYAIYHAIMALSRAIRELEDIDNVSKHR